MKSRMLALAAILMVVMGTIGVAFAQEERGSTREEIKGKRLLHRYNVVFRQAEQSRIGMEAVIAYVDEIGNDSTTLAGIKDNFVAKVGELKTAAEGNDFEGFKDVTSDMRDLIKDFRDEAHNVLGTDVGEARTRVAQAIQGQRDYLNSLVDEIRTARGEVELEAVDEAIEDVEERTDKAVERGADATELKAKLAEIKEKREELKLKIDAAIASCGEAGLGKCDTPEAQEYKALKEEIKDDFKGLKEIAKATGLKKRISKGIEAAGNVLEKANERLERAEESGVDVTTAKAKLDEVQRLLDSAEEKLDAGDYEGAMDELKAARTAFVSAMKETRELRRTEKPERARGKSGERIRGAEEPEDEHEEEPETEEEPEDVDEEEETETEDEEEDEQENESTSGGGQ